MSTVECKEYKADDLDIDYKIEVEEILRRERVGANLDKITDKLTKQVQTEIEFQRNGINEHGYELDLNSVKEKAIGALNEIIEEYDTGEREDLSKYLHMEKGELYSLEV